MEATLDLLPASVARPPTLLQAKERSSRSLLAGQWMIHEKMMVLAVETAHWDKYAKEETHEHEGLGLHSLLQIKREEDIREF